jgi:hypothetical protein
LRKELGGQAIAQQQTFTQKTPNQERHEAAEAMKITTTTTTSSSTFSRNKENIYDVIVITRSGMLRIVISSSRLPMDLSLTK